MTTHANTSDKRESLWIVTIAPAIWAAHFLLCYGTVALWCGMVVGRDGPLLTARIAVGVYTAVALAAIAFVGWIGYRRHTDLASEPHGGDSPASRHRFLGYATLLLSGLSAVATIYGAMPALFFENCQ